LRFSGPVRHPLDCGYYSINVSHAYGTLPIDQEITMTSPQTLAALFVAAILAAPFGASAATPSKADEHAAHHPDASASAPGPAMDERMKAMQEMRDKMASAKTPEERQALMADHMLAMQGGMQMMKAMETPGMGGMGGMGGMARMADKSGKPTMGPKPGTKGIPADMAQQHQMMEGRMDMMQTMMEMMMQRMPATPAPGK